MFMSSESFTDAATSSQSIGIVRKENESIKRLNTQVWQQGTCTYLACGVHVPGGNTMVLEISILWETAILDLQIASSHPSCPPICFPFVFPSSFSSSLPNSDGSSSLDLSSPKLGIAQHLRSPRSSINDKCIWFD
ncbi:unnamed protein product [Musa acuminata var. zebrina]